MHNVEDKIRNQKTVRTLHNSEQERYCATLNCITSKIRNKLSLSCCAQWWSWNSKPKHHVHSLCVQAGGILCNLELHNMQLTAVHYQSSKTRTPKFTPLPPVMTREYRMKAREWLTLKWLPELFPEIMAVDSSMRGMTRPGIQSPGWLAQDQAFLYEPQLSYWFSYRWTLIIDVCAHVT